jgi:hypothetical protein
MADTKVLVTTLSTGTAIDNVSVTTGAGAVNRQRVTIADLITEIDASGTVGTSPVTAISAGIATQWVDIENVSYANGNLLGYTYDGSTPAFSGGFPTAGTLCLQIGGTKQYSLRIPSGALQVVGSASGTVYTIKYA